MKAIVRILLALACAALANAAYAAPTGMPLMKGFKSPTELAGLVEKSMKVDPTGSQVLDPVRCKRSGSCATAQDYFKGIKLAHPSAALGDIAELPRYLRSLVQKPAPEGQWQVSRLLVKGDTHRYDAVGWHRAFFKGEDVWFDVNTGEPILAGECGNVVGKPVAPPRAVPPQKKCVELSFDAPVGGYVRWGVGTLAGRSLLADECNAQRQGDGPWVSWYGECDTCIPAIGYIRKTIGGTAQIYQKFLYPVKQVKQTLRFSTEVWANLVYICLEDGGVVAGRKIGIHSCGVYMRPQDWQGRYRVEIPDALWVWGDCPK